MMDPIAVYIGDVFIYWSALIVALAVCAWFCLSAAVYTAGGGRAIAMWVFLPLAWGLGLLLSRALHWYCHTEQYVSLTGALTDYAAGGYCMPGVLLGVVLAALLLRLVRLIPSAARLLDAAAPGAALGIALIRLSALFNTTCRGSIIITDPAYQRLPLASPIITASGAAEFHFATFFVQFLLLLVLTVLLLVFHLRRSGRPMKCGPGAGHTALLFLLLFSVTELVLDSTRYDSSFLRSNGFVSVVQICSALCVLAVLVFYSVCSVRGNKLRWYHWLLWTGYLASVGGTGYLEYLVQRHGDWYMACYGGMSACCALMALTVHILYRTVLSPKKEAAAAPQDAPVALTQADSPD